MERTESINFKYIINIDTAFSMCGSIYVALGNSFTANCLWSVGNLFLIKRNWKKDWAQVVLFMFFEITAIYGIINHYRGVY
jgi:hypothetical protein